MIEQFDVKLMILNAVKHRRNQLLQESDWTVLPDAPTDKTAWQTYRQQLRDITDDPRIDTLNHWDDLVALEFFPQQPAE
jgi:hypothetical protein